MKKEEMLKELREEYLEKIVNLEKMDADIVSLLDAQEGIYEYCNNHSDEMIKKFRIEISYQREENINKLLTGKLKIKLQYHDGEYLSGYETTGEGCSQADELLEKLEVAHYVSGWGTIVDDKIVKMFGEEFTYQQVEEYAKPILEEKEKNIKQRELKKKIAKEEKFKQAKETGKPVPLDKYVTNCDKTVEDCSLDLITIYAMPDGTEKTERIHSY